MKNTLYTILILLTTSSLFSQQFLLQIETSSSSESFTIPTFPNQPAPGYNYSINWGDGNNDFGQGGDITHVYDSAGTYTISIS